MAEYIIKRLGLALLTLFIIMVVSYTLLRLAPGDPTKSSIMGETSGEGMSAEKGAFAQNRAMREKLFLDKPVYIGFIFWLKGVVCHGDFGTSASVDTGRPVTDILLESLPVTLKLNILPCSYICWPSRRDNRSLCGQLFDRIVTSTVLTRCRSSGCR
jgi:peptide/nickel transport system permease protein